MERYFTLDNILEELDENVKVSKKDLLAVCQVIARALVRGERVKLTHVGTLFAKEFPGRNSRNPKTGESIEIGPSRRLRVKATKALKESLLI